jgi:superfamily II DNA or RNA helicase
MALSFGSSFSSEIGKFDYIESIEEFRKSIIPFVQYMENCFITNHPHSEEIRNWEVTLYNEERHSLFKHQVIAIRGCFDQVILSDSVNSGYCFMPTSAGKGHILMTLAGLAVGDFFVQKHVYELMPDIWETRPEIFDVLISLGLMYSKLVDSPNTKKTQILVHDTEILKQLEGDCRKLLGTGLSGKVQFHSVQALRNVRRRKNLKFVIIDECHWGNATEEDTIQSSLIQEVKDNGGNAFGFTASPYQHPNSKFQRTWSSNPIASDLTFNYYLDKAILYPVTLREVNLQNARLDFEDGGEEVDLQEKEQVITFMVDYIKTTLPEEKLDGPAMCYFSNIIIPDIVEKLLEKIPYLKGKIKVLGSESAFFAKKCQEMFGDEILATDEDIEKIKNGELIFMISRQKLLVGFNAPLLKYCFISPTNSKITIMQGIGRLMRPISYEKVPKKLATLFLTSLSGKKLDISGKGAEPNPDDNDSTGDDSRTDEHDNPKTRYTTSSMTLSEAYDLPNPVFYKIEVGFRDFINETRIKDGNSVERVKRKNINPEELDKFDPIQLKQELNRIRDMVRSQYKRFIQERDSKVVDGRKLWYCHGKKVIGEEGCNRTQLEVRLEIHHLEPNTFSSLYSRLGPEGVVEWHRVHDNMKFLVTLCPACHVLIHSKKNEEDDVA